MPYPHFDLILEWAVVFVVFGVLWGFLIDALGMVFAVVDALRGAGRARR